ncbi:MAG TPA: hypothetical protein VFR80_14320, partial [Pyrinomonadaceae bacterium]|nr:hypothetical protein [Pyrinomonadaceae bacterium]
GCLEKTVLIAWNYFGEDLRLRPQCNQVFSSYELLIIFHDNRVAHLLRNVAPFVSTGQIKLGLKITDYEGDYSTFADRVKEPAVWLKNVRAYRCKYNGPGCI